MRTRTILASFLILMALPAAAPAQANWVLGINPGFVHQPVVPALLPSGGVFRQGGVILPSIQVVPRTTVIQSGTTVIQQGGTTIIQPGPVIVLPDRTRGSRVGPGAERRVDRHPKGVIVTSVSPHVFSGVIGTAGLPIRSGIAPPIDLGRNISGGAPSVTHSGGIVVGMPRADVIRMLGRPSATVYRSSGRETLLFSNTTIIIQNGVVAVVQ